MRHNSNLDDRNLGTRFRIWMGIAFVLMNLSHVRPVTATPVAVATMIFLQIHPSPEANGRAGVLLQTGFDDPLGVISNPALLGLAAQNNLVALGFYPAKTEWLPSFGLDLTYSAKAYNLGLSPETISKFVDRDIPFSFGVGYNEVLLDLGVTERRDDLGNYLGTFRAIEKCSGTSLGIGIDYLIKASFGVTFKHVKSDLGDYIATIDLVDWGYVIQVPLHKAFLRLQDRNAELRDGIQLEVTPAFSYAKRNIGDKVSYLPTSNPDPTPRTANVDVSLMAAITRADPETEDWTILSVETGTRGESGLFYKEQSGETGYIYNHLGDISIWNDLILGKTNNQIEKSKAWEVEFLESVAFRWGRYEDFTGKVFSKNSGFSLRTTGYHKYYRRINQQNAGAVGFVTGRIDVEYSYSSYDAGQGHPLTGTKFHQISLFFR